MLSIGKAPGRQLSTLVPNARALNRMSAITGILRNLDFDPRQFWSSYDQGGVHVSLRSGLSTPPDSHFEVDLSGGPNVIVHGGMMHYDALGGRSDIPLTCDGGPAADYASFRTLSVTSNAVTQYVVLRSTDPLGAGTLEPVIRESVPWGEDGEPRSDWALARLTVANSLDSNNAEVLAVTNVEMNCRGDLQYTYDAPMDNCSLGWVNTDHGESESSDEGYLWEREIMWWHNADAHTVSPPDADDLFLLRQNSSGCSEYHRYADLMNAVEDAANNATSIHDCSDVDACVDNYNICDKVSNCDPIEGAAHTLLDYSASTTGNGSNNLDHDYDYAPIGDLCCNAYWTSIGFGTARPRAGAGSGSLRVDLSNCQLTPDGVESNWTADWAACQLRDNTGHSNSVDWDSHTLTAYGSEWEVVQGTRFLLSDSSDAVNSSAFANASIRCAGGAEINCNVAAGGYWIGNGLKVHSNAADCVGWYSGNAILSADVSATLGYGNTSASNAAVTVSVDSVSIWPNTGTVDLCNGSGNVSYNALAGMTIANWTSVGGVVGDDILAEDGLYLCFANGDLVGPRELLTIGG